MGPNGFALFDKVLEVLRDLQQTGLRLGVISDWQKGLTHFCDELGIGAYLDVVVASGEVGFQKPDWRLFEIARERLKLAPHEILHVGDRVADVEGALSAGFSAALLVRDSQASKNAWPGRRVTRRSPWQKPAARLVRSGEAQAADVPVITNLGDLLTRGNR